VPRVDQQYREPAHRGFARDRGALDAGADDDDVERAAVQFSRLGAQAADHGAAARTAPAPHGDDR
jgi:hypothetical protein